MSKPRRSFDPTAAKLAISIPAGAEDQLLTKRQAAELGGKKRAESLSKQRRSEIASRSRESALEALFTLNKKPRLAAGGRAAVQNRPHSFRAVHYALNKKAPTNMRRGQSLLRDQQSPGARPATLSVTATAALGVIQP